MKPELDNIFSKARDQIGTGKVNKAFTLLLGEQEIVKSHRKELLVLRNNYSSLSSQYAIGIIDEKHYSQQKNRTCFGLLQILEEIEIDNQPKKNLNVKKRRHIQIYSLVILLIIFIFYAGNRLYSKKRHEKALLVCNKHYEKEEFSKADNCYEKLNNLDLDKLNKLRKENCMNIVKGIKSQVRGSYDDAIHYYMKVIDKPRSIINQINISRAMGIKRNNQEDNESKNNSKVPKESDEIVKKTTEFIESLKQSDES